jgi:sterol desaturase/sphingolipid hydroxylase (fatty acid hydroxylase superfamily)
MGVLERFMVTPSNHRVHHGQNDYCIDRNYGGIFSVWDKMFGTYADEREDEKVVYGVRKPLRSWDPVWGNIHHYVLIARLVRGASSWRERLVHVFGKPRGPVLLAAVEEKPFKPEEFVPFATPAPRFMQVIGVCSTLLGAAALMTFYWLLPGMSLGQSLLYMAAMLAFFSFIGQLWLHPRVTGAARQ